MSKTTFYVGLDLGQRRDYTAMAVVERRKGQLLVRHLERVALGTPYPDVVERVRELVRSDVLQGHCIVVADGTGVGAPVVDLMRASGLGCEVTQVTITRGKRERWNAPVWHVPKGNLVAVVRKALGRGKLRIARGMPGTAALVRELTDVRMGRVRIGADGYGEHDDLVMALALGCWRAGRLRPCRQDPGADSPAPIPDADFPI